MQTWQLIVHKVFTQSFGRSYVNEAKYNTGNVIYSRNVICAGTTVGDTVIMNSVGFRAQETLRD